MRKSGKATDGNSLAALRTAGARLPRRASQTRAQSNSRDDWDESTLKSALDAGLEQCREPIDDYAASLVAARSEITPGEITTILDISGFYEKIADATATLKMARLAFELAEAQNDDNLKRRASNILGIAYARSYDFRASSSHLLRSVKLAADLKKPLFELAALSNVVSLLDIMGLRQDADRLCTILLTDRWANDRDKLGEALIQVQLQNAINGASISRTNGDLEKSRIYIERAEDFAKQVPISATLRAYLASVKASVLADQGETKRASNSIEQSIVALYGGGNNQAKVALAVAEADVASHSCTNVRFLACSERLFGLLRTATDFAPHTERILRSLVRLHASQDDEVRRSVGRKLLAQLTEHQIMTKHRQFYDQFNRDFIPASLADLPGSQVTEDFVGSSARDVYFDDAVALVNSVVSGYVDQTLFDDSLQKSRETPFRSDAYRAAENWATAADLRSGGSGRHGRLVGTLAREIGLIIGYSDKRATKLELACRLHDVGKLAVAGDPSFEMCLCVADKVFVLGQHAAAGQTILSGQGDSTLDLGATIALLHHENWNGFGRPDRVKGPLIPEEARICAVANNWADILEHFGGDMVQTARWSKHQLSSMAGVQLDPGIVAAVTATLLDGPRYDCFFGKAIGRLH